MSDEPHRLLLCGTSVHDQVFMTIDDLSIDDSSPDHGPEMPYALNSGGAEAEDHLDEDDEALLDVAESQMLVYLQLRYGPQVGLRLVPLSAERHSRPRTHTGSLTPLEVDVATAELRYRLRANPPADDRELRQHPEAAEFLTCRVPGTDVHLGMSRRLFAACERLHHEQMQIVDDLPSALPEVASSRPDQVPEEDEALRERRYQQFSDQYRERELARRYRLRPAVRRAFQEADTRDWAELTGGAQLQVALGDGGLLEGATAETYIALEATNPLLPSTPRP